MPEIDHNAPGFHYRVSYRRDIPGEVYTSEDVNDWRKGQLLVPNLPTFSKYIIKVIALNNLGEANVSPKEVKIINFLI